MTTTDTNLRKLRLSSMAAALEHQLEQPGTYYELSFTERLDLLLDHELQNRKARRHRRLIRAAEFRLSASLNQIDYAGQRNLNRRQIADLGQCNWINQAHNLLICGATGSGKSFVATALGQAACRLDHKVRYARVTTLMSAIEQSKALGSYPKLYEQLATVALLIIDDFGVQPLTDTQRYELLELMDRRYLRYSTMVVSQLPTTEWHAAIGDATLADAILDRLMHNAHRIELKGESMRKRNTVHESPGAPPNPGPCE